ncbi:MAG: cytochrome c oxidase subunit 3 [Ilumatobacteraceae bacterium]
MTAASRVPTAGRAPARSTGQFGVVVFLASDVMLFAPFFAAYLLLRSTNSLWPASGVELDVPRAGAATLVLIASSFTLLVADRAHARGDALAFRRWLLITILFGLGFLANQIAEYATLPFAADDHVYGSIYWALTGLHAAHVLAGVSCLGLVFIRSARTRSADEITPWVNGASLFWHLVDVIWIAVFLLIWVLQ